ncbi:hypothetical protein L2E82_47083 [Cichorium intybus]|uniref:Uncharacterized protein n=1 Tax=Cichorium intybus TaxID=13427 RepID=A0ACB8YUT7_CICIN|nr:hypothetical protein L2E82_47083 [Cichorium intybus]
MDFKNEKQVRFYTGKNEKSKFDHSWQLRDKQLPEHKMSAPLLMNGGKSHMTIKLGKSRVHPEENTPFPTFCLYIHRPLILSLNNLLAFTTTSYPFFPTPDGT